MGQPPAGSVPDDVQYQWQTCDPTGATCSDITGETAQAFDATSAHDGQRIRVVTTVQNISGTATAASPLSPPLQASTATLIGKLVYVDQAGTGLYVANGDGSDPTEISDCTHLTLTGLGDALDNTGSCQFHQPVVSANGQMIAVTVIPDSFANCSDVPCGLAGDDIVTMNLDGTDAQQLPFNGDKPAWTPDGTALIYTGLAAAGGTQPNGFTPDTQLYTTYLADPAASNAPVAMPAGTVSTDAGYFSADGLSLTYSALTAASQWVLYSANPDGSDPEPVPGAPVSGQPQAASFAPGGQSVLYSAPAGQPDEFGFTFNGVYEQDIDPGPPTLITPPNATDVDYHAIAVLPDGSVLATKRTVTVVLSSGGGVSLAYGPTIPCAITPVDAACAPAGSLPTNLSDLQVGIGTDYGAGQPGGPASGPPGSLPSPAPPAPPGSSPSPLGPVGWALKRDDVGINDRDIRFTTRLPSPPAAPVPPEPEEEQKLSNDLHALWTARNAFEAQYTQSTWTTFLTAYNALARELGNAQLDVDADPQHFTSVYSYYNTQHELVKGEVVLFIGGRDAKHLVAEKVFPTPPPDGDYDTVYGDLAARAIETQKLTGPAVDAFLNENVIALDYATRAYLDLLPGAPTSLSGADIIAGGVNDADVQNLVVSLYRPVTASSIGDGSTMDALDSEAESGCGTACEHYTKAIEARQNIFKNLIGKPGLSEYEDNVVETLYDQLSSAIDKADELANRPH